MLSHEPAVLVHDDGDFQIYRCDSCASLPYQLRERTERGYWETLSFWATEGGARAKIQSERGRTREDGRDAS